MIVLSGAPVLPVPGTPESAPSGDETRLLVDQLVGQINGRPVYADEFFEPMDERLRREAERLPPREWLSLARKEIESALWDTLRDELLLAEFETGLTAEQRQGLLAFVEDIRRDVVSGNLGSPELARQRLLDTEGLDLESKVKDVSQREFIAFQLRKAIGSRVNVAARDIERYYEQNLDEFAPPPTARFRIVRVPRSDPARVAEAESALGSGEDFASVAKRFSTWAPNAENRRDVEMTDRDFSRIELFAAESLNEAARALTPGGVTPRTDFGGDAWWIRLESIEEKPGKPLYEVQREIEQKIRAARVREEETRYFEQLFRRGSYSDVKQMTNRLFEFAAERYLIVKSGDPAAPGR